MANYKIIIGGVVLTIILAMFIASLLFLIGVFDKAVDTSIKYLCMIIFSILPALLASMIFIFNLQKYFIGKGKSSAFIGMISFIIATLMIISLIIGGKNL